jgi:hypothetical protein
MAANGEGRIEYVFEEAGFGGVGERRIIGAKDQRAGSVSNLFKLTFMGRFG